MSRTLNLINSRADSKHRPSIPYATPLQSLRINAEQQPGETALIDTDRSWTYEELYIDVLTFADHLVCEGVQPTQRVLLASDDYGDFFRLMYATWATGATVVPLNLSLGLQQRTQIIQKCRPHVLVCGDSELSVDKWKGPTVNLRGHGCKRNTSFEPRDVDPDQDAMIMFTSGTTGVPKGVCNSHRALAMNSYLTSCALGLSNHDRILINTPAYYTSAIIHLLTLLAQGGSLVAHKGFLFADTFCNLVTQHECTGFGGAPAHFARIFETLDVATPRPGRLRFMMSSGDHLPVQRIEKAHQVFPGLDIHCVYGLSEVAGRLCFLPPERIPSKYGSVGKPLFGMTVTVRSESTLKELPPGEVGEVFVNGPMLMRSYFDPGTSERELITPHGFRTGDFGFLDDEGFLFLQGRKDDIFKSGGEKVSALMIQNALATQNMFSDVAVLPIEDELMGKVPVAFYVLKSGVPFDRRRLIMKLEETLPRTYIPRRFVPVERIPRTGSGKVIRRELLVVGVPA